MIANKNVLKEHGKLTKTSNYLLCNLSETRQNILNLMTIQMSFDLQSSSIKKHSYWSLKLKKENYKGCCKIVAQMLQSCKHHTSK